MAEKLTYVRVNWEDSPSENTPINSENLNKMDAAIEAVVNIANQNSEQIDDILENGTTGGGTIASSVEPMEDDIPKIYFTGTLPTSKVDEDLPVTARYISKTLDFKCPATLKVQGHSSTAFPKKNFTMKLYEDDTYEKKVKVSFKNWGGLNKFVLKAHWVDASHVRNVGSAKLFGKIVRSRSDFESLPEELRNAPNNGATDGFTVKVFANGIYQGLYELIVPKDKLFGQDSDNPKHSILNSENNADLACAFAKTVTSPSNWSEELQDSMSSDTSVSFANLISFVADSTDEEFVANAENYFDVLSVIDFDIFARIICPVDNLCKNQIFFKYDTKWYEGAWDLDCVLGLTPSLTWTGYDTHFQEGYVAYKNHGVTNMLYKRVEENFLERFKARYWELREDVLSVENVIEAFERLTDVITNYDGLLSEDYAPTTGGGAFTGIPLKDSNNIQQIRNWIANRFVYMDEVITNMIPPVPCTGIMLDKNSISFETLGSTETIVAMVTPENTTDAVVWSSDNEGVATVTQEGVVTPVGIGNANITATCGEYSASCSVVIEFIKVPCTSITLSQNTLTFSGEGTQTLTATVNPTNTTDALVWSSDNENVASVVDGIVTAKKNGTANITATCGSKSATCVVTISGIEMNILKDVNWNNGYIRGDGSGSIGGSSTDVYTDAIDVSGLSGLYVTYEFVTHYTSPSTHRCVFYSSDNKAVSTTSNATIEQRTFGFDEIPTGATYMRLSFMIGANNSYGFGGFTIQETADGEVIGRLPYPKS